MYHRFVTKWYWFVLAVVGLAALTSQVQAETALYWDTDLAGGIQAGSGTWDSSTAIWSSATGGSNPLNRWTSGSDAVFLTSGTSAITGTGYYATGPRANSLTFSGTGYTLFDSTGGVTVGSGGIVANESASIGVNQYYGMAVGANQSWTVATGKTLNIGNSGASFLGGPYTVNVNGPGTVSTGVLRSAGGGAINQSAGTVSATGDMGVGYSGNGTYTLTGGTLDSGGKLWVGAYGGVGTFNQNGGTVNIAAGKYLALGVAGAGPGGTGSMGTYNLNGGTLNLSSMANWGDNTYPDYAFNFNGGTMSFTATTTQAYNFNVQSGGAKIDTPMGNIATFNGALLEDATSPGGGLTKSGWGHLYLNGNNTYTGDTILEQGPLFLTQACLDDHAAVRITTAPSGSWTCLALNFVGADTVGALYFDGVAQASGTWGQTGSGAQHIDNVHFSGEGCFGMLNVVPEPSTMALLCTGLLGLLAYAWRRRK